jgi:hypothetical protein
MALVPVPRLEPQIEHTMGGGFLLTVPKRRAWWPMLFLPLWLVAWAFGEVTVLRQLLSGFHSGAPSLFMIVWITAWTLGGSWALATVAWLFAGRERVRIEQGKLTLEHVLGPLGRQRTYELRQVTRLRTLSQTSQDLMAANMTPFGFGRAGALAFDYGSSTVRWGAGLDEAEARVVVERLVERGVSREANGIGSGAA